MSARTSRSLNGRLSRAMIFMTAPAGLPDTTCVACCPEAVRNRIGRTEAVSFQVLSFDHKKLALAVTRDPDGRNPGGADHSASAGEVGGRAVRTEQRNLAVLDLLDDGVAPRGKAEVNGIGEPEVVRRDMGTRSHHRTRFLIVTAEPPTSGTRRVSMTRVHSPSHFMC